MAEVDARFGEDQPRPSLREIEASRDFHAKLQHSIPSNPTDKDCFKDEDWKIFLKARDPLTERLTGQKDGKLTQGDPEKLEAQIKRFAQEVEALGWSLTGPEASCMFWDLLPAEWKLSLRDTSCY